MKKTEYWRRVGANKEADANFLEDKKVGFNLVFTPYSLTLKTFPLTCSVR